MESRLLATFSLSPFHKTRLNQCGFVTLGDLKEAERTKICQVTGLSSEDIENVFQVIQETLKDSPKPVMASELLKKAEETCPLVSFCEKLDEALGGGVQLGQLTEISGIPGVGKTQLCIQLSCDVQIPSLFGGLDGEAVYIDTEGGFVMDRVVEIVTATVNHCKQIAMQEQEQEWEQFFENFSVQKLLSGIHIYPCTTESHLLALVNLLPDLLEENQKIKLVVIDSIAFHFRHDFEDLSLRTKLLTNLAQTLLGIAQKFNISVVVTNQMTTKVRSRSDDSSSVVPALGDSWGHACTNRIRLEYGAWCRVAWIQKSPTQKQSKVLYQITKDGFRDSTISFQGENPDFEENHINSSPENPSKRQRCM